MEKESFEDSSVAEMMNNAFVNIKVDREERPDIDNIYMAVCQMLTGSGGWPMTIIMTPDKKPFFAGTYFPKEGNYGRMGMMQLIPRIDALWKTKRDEILHSSEQIHEALKQTSQSFLGDDFDEKILTKTYRQLSERFDIENGGFGGAPKFPTPHTLSFLLRCAKRNSSSDALNIAETTLQAIRNGGIYDHIGGGIHRYSTDKEWLVPHFEKMIYDQALFVIASVEAFQITKKDFYKIAAEETLNFILEELTSENGGFYSAIDADSEGEEGKFYLWTTAEARELLNDDAEIFISHFNFKEEGNYFDPLQGGFNKLNILNVTSTIAKTASVFGIGEAECGERISSSLKKMKAIRNNRTHPFKDDKILTDWNGLTIAAFAKAGSAFNNSNYINAAEKAFNFIMKNLYDENGNLLHRYRDGEAAIHAHADDYVYLILGAIEMYNASFNLYYLEKALSLQGDFTSKFWDEEYGGFYFTASNSEAMLIRQKEIYDGAIPSANSVSLSNLVRLYKLTGDVKYLNHSVDLARAFYSAVSSMPTSYSQFLIGVDLQLAQAYELVIVADSCDQIENSLFENLRNDFNPYLTIICKDKNSEEKLSRVAPFTNAMTATDNKPTFYLCKNFACELPTNDYKSILEKLQ